jgi:hypothetical protein
MGGEGLTLQECLGLGFVEELRMQVSPRPRGGLSVRDPLVSLGETGDHVEAWEGGLPKTITPNTSGSVTSGVLSRSQVAAGTGRRNPCNDEIR